MVVVVVVVVVVEFQGPPVVVVVLCGGRSVVVLVVVVEFQCPPAMPVVVGVVVEEPVEPAASSILRVGWDTIVYPELHPSQKPLLSEQLLQLLTSAMQQ